MSDHRHEAYDIYGTAATTGDVQQVQSQADGLREDLAAAETRIRELEEQLARDIRQLWTHIGNMPGGI